MVHLSTLIQSERKKNINKEMMILSSRLNARKYIYNQDSDLDRQNDRNNNKYR